MTRENWLTSSPPVEYKGSSIPRLQTIITVPRMVDQKMPHLEEVVVARLLRLDAVMQGVVTGVMAGLGLFVATNWLVIQGGQVGPNGEIVLGPHLSLLGQFFIGYRVSFVGSLIGFVYAAVCGFVVGHCVAGMYNWFVSLREHKFQDRA